MFLLLLTSFSEEKLYIENKQSIFLDAKSIQLKEEKSF